jgi:hypothetical protein
MTADGWSRQKWWGVERKRECWGFECSGTKKGGATGAVLLGVFWGVLQSAHKIALSNSLCFPESRLLGVGPLDQPRGTERVVERGEMGRGTRSLLLSEGLAVFAQEIGTVILFKTIVRRFDTGHANGR